MRKKENEHEDLMRKKENEHEDLMRKKNNDQHDLLRQKEDEIQELKNALLQVAGLSDHITGYYQQLQEVLGRRPLFAGQERGKERFYAVEKHAQRSTSESKGKKRVANEMMDGLLTKTKSQRSMEKARKTDMSPQGSPSHCLVEPSDKEDDEQDYERDSGIYFKDSDL